MAKRKARKSTKIKATKRKTTARGRRSPGSPVLIDKGVALIDS